MKRLILDKIEKPISIEELSSITGLNNSEIFEILNNMEKEGYIISRECRVDGIVRYYIDTQNKKSSININYFFRTFKLLILSDSHMGRNKYNRYFDLIENYIINNDIHITLFLGDMIDGVIDNNKTNDSLIKTQIQEFLDNFPNITNNIVLYILGNHDYSAYHYNGIDIKEMIDTREDFIYVATGAGNIRIGKDLVTLRHDLVLKEMPSDIENGRVIFKGHSHKYCINNNVVIVPALLEDPFYKDILSRGFLEATITMDNDDHIKDLSLKHLVFDKGRIRDVSDNVVQLPNIKVKKNI